MNTGQTDGRVAGDASGARGGALGNRVTYSFIAYREFPGEAVWIDELYTAECVRQQGVARWLVWQVGYRRHVELQVSERGFDRAGGGGATLVYDDGP